MALKPLLVNLAQVAQQVGIDPSFATKDKSTATAIPVRDKESFMNLAPASLTPNQNAFTAVPQVAGLAPAQPAAFANRGPTTNGISSNVWIVGALALVAILFFMVRK